MDTIIELTNAHLSRQLDLIPVERLGLPIKIIGVGAIGSFVCLQLAKMGCTDIEVWDYDMVSVENMSCQFYRFKDIGKPKVVALQELVKDFTNQEIKIHNERYVPTDMHRGVVILAVDCMKTRKNLWNEIRDTSFGVKLVIDPRMGAEDALLYAMNPFDDKDVDSYEKTLYTNEQAVQERCTAKSTIYTANLLSGMVAKVVKNIVCQEKYPRISMWGIGTNDLQQWSN
jgi:molybdopterin-synthase adenylyltransferase